MSGLSIDVIDMFDSHHQAVAKMNPSNENPPRVKQPNDRQPPSPDVRQIVEEYINDLRELMRKLRIKLH